MRAAVTTDGTFSDVDLPDPAPGADELVVCVTACGVCGSDLKAQHFMPPGTVMGHEFGGEVVGVGRAARADGWREGSTVAVLPVVSCGACAWCVEGHVAHCSAVRFIGMGSDAGGFAEFAVVPARHAFALPPELPNAFAPLVEPFAVGLHGVVSAEVSARDEIVVVGAGGVGLTTVAWARAKGVARVTVVDPDAGRRAAARAIGADDDLRSLDEAEPGSYDALIECVGRPDLIELGATIVRPRGRVVVAGAGIEPISIEPIAGLLKELTLRFSVAYRPDEFREVIDAFTTGAIDPGAMLGPVFGLDRVADAFDLVRGGGAQGRVLVSPTTTL
jgi:(R,R)-butanediol dehydrogenase/meso-butanediol dehydrogenase/diacetyl reductase